jgi:transcriptional regulator with XRE-family HTH domain
MSITIHEGERLRWWVEKKFKRYDELINNGTVNSYEILNYYFNKAQIKRSKLEYFCKALGITIDTFYKSVNDDILNTGSTQDANSPYSISKHQGKNLQTTLKDKGVTTAAFAKKMKVSRPTIYKMFSEAELPIGTLLEAAQTLKIPAAQLKGIGIGQNSFEKDIYNELRTINEKLNTLISFAKQRGLSA